MRIRVALRRRIRECEGLMPRNTPSKGSCTRFPAFNFLISGLANRPPPLFFLAFCEHSFAHLRYISLSQQLVSRFM